MGLLPNFYIALLVSSSPTFPQTGLEGRRGTYCFILETETLPLHWMFKPSRTSGKHEKGAIAGSEVHISVGKVSLYFPSPMVGTQVSA